MRLEVKYLLMVFPTVPHRHGQSGLSFHFTLQVHHGIDNPRQSVERKTLTLTDFFFWFCGGADASRYIIEIDSSLETRALSFSLIPATLLLRKEKEPQDRELIELRFHEHLGRNIAAAVLAFLEKKSSLVLAATELIYSKADFISWGILSHQPLGYFKENEAIDVAFLVHEQSQGRLVVSVHSSTGAEQKIVVETQLDTILVKNYEETTEPVLCPKGCSKTFTSQKGLTHYCGTDQLACPKGCNKTFISQSGLNDHFCQPVPCPKGCSRTFTSQNGLSDHFCQPVPCSKDCSRTFTSQNGLSRHRCGTDLLVCPKGCSQIFTSQNGLDRHRCGTDLLVCPKGCSKTFTSQSGLSRHRCGTDLLVCPKGCSRIFTSQNGLADHLCQPVPCPKGCSKTLTSQSGLARHRCRTAKSAGRVRQARKTKSVKQASHSGISATKKLKLDQ